MNRVHPNCTERQSLNKECGWKGGDRSGLAQGQELTVRKRRTKTSLQEEKRKNRKTHLTHTGLLMEGSGAVAKRNRIVERAHQGIRRADGENRPGELPASRAAQTGEGGRNTDCADVCPNPRRPASVRQESRGRMFSRIKTWAQRLRREPAADANQQRRRPLFENDDGARGTLYSGALWGR